MEVPVYSRRSSCLEAPIRVFQAGTVRVRNCTAFLGSFLCWKSTFSDQRLAIASARSALFLRAIDSRVHCKASPAPNSSPFGYEGKHPEPASPHRSDAALLASERARCSLSSGGSSALRKKSIGSKELALNSSNSKVEERTLSGQPPAGKVHSSGLGPRLAKTQRARPPRRKHKHQLLSQAQIEEEKARKQVEVKERVAMAEANGFRLSKRSKKNPEELRYVLKLNLCSKHGDLRGALEIYDKVCTGEMFKLKQHQYNMLLYICSGAASGSIVKAKGGKVSAAADTLETNKQSVKGSEERMEEAFKEEGEDGKDLVVATFSQEEMQLAARRGTQIYEDMLRAKIPPNEATFTAVARLAVAKGDGDLAFETVKKMAAAGMAPKLRTYGPAILCFCEHNQIEKAFEVDAHMAAAGVLPDENLLEALLRISIAAGLEAKVYTLLQRLRKTVRDVSPTTLMTIERWFNSETAASVGCHKCDSPPSEEDIRKAAESTGGGWHGLGWLGEGKWVTKRTTISKAGVCQSCGDTLCTIDLDPEETEKFAKSVAELAMQRERNPNEFVTFQQWLEKNGPFEAVIDAANIGMFNSSLRGFNYSQVATVANAMKSRSLIKRPPLIVLHCRRTSDGGSRSPRSQNIIDSWVNENILYSTPHGSNDDWYWMYAAVKCKSLLVTNDEMRDHLFELLGNNFFPKWKERHQVRFTFSANGLELLMPPPYSTIIQESQGGSWHIPHSGGNDVESPREWMCVTRSSTLLSELKRSTTLEQKPNVEMLPKDGINKRGCDSNLVSPSKERIKDCSSQASGEKIPALSCSSETLLKLEAAEQASMSVITYDI
ncbi:hypothetical protein GOP47_0003158 [Adiantum capillus-veneris]|uniref:ribonuclease P n=1 Tax=Adiantum capillus-veneris TaxID=13818 RepID=A0A9D4VBF7_ADICA|nr:hypothetical protein GOP47_0003158 [Adiantum capillus-veneris]